jgi:hypothetical protein
MGWQCRAWINCTREELFREQRLILIPCFNDGESLRRPYGASAVVCPCLEGCRGVEYREKRVPRLVWGNVLLGELGEMCFV